MTIGDFNRYILRRLGAPYKTHNRRALAAEAQSEGVSEHSAKNNPYNTTQRMPHSTPFNSVGVQNYATPIEGVEATIRTLRYKGHGYWRIIAALKVNAPATVTVTAFGLSDWGTKLSLVREVLDDIKHDRTPNTLAQIEARQIPS
jgi:hypothetical protein